MVSAVIIAEPPSRVRAADAKRDPRYAELCAEIAALSDLDEWNAFSQALEGRLEAFPQGGPTGWEDVFTDAMEAQRLALLEALT